MGNTNAEAGSVRIRYDWSNTVPSTAIVDAIAVFEDTQPMDLWRASGTTLFDHVEPEALDRLVTGDDEIAVSFAVDEYTIAIDGTGLTVGYD